MPPDGRGLPLRVASIPLVTEAVETMSFGPQRQTTVGGVREASWSLPDRAAFG
jgi:hypothetical protein